VVVVVERGKIVETTVLVVDGAGFGRVTGVRAGGR
jgi:hypothetical protein